MAHAFTDELATQSQSTANDAHRGDLHGGPKGAAIPPYKTQRDKVQSLAK